MTARMEHKGIAPRIWSPKIWGNIPIEEWALGLGGKLYHDDFLNFAQHISDQDTQQYASYIDTGVTIMQAPDYADGAAEWDGMDADNDEGIITTGGNKGGLVKIDTDALLLTAFECRIRKSSVADDAVAFFVGLAEEALAASLTLTDDDGALASKDMIGFHVDQADGDSIDFVWREAGQTAKVLISGVQAMAAGTWYNLGFKIDPNRPPSERLQVYVDNTEQTTYGTQTLLDVSGAASGFPDDEELALLCDAKVGTGSLSDTFELDWWAIGQAAA